MEKICISCHTAKPLEGFYRNRREKDGRASYCAECSKAYNAKWRTANARRYKHLMLKAWTGTGIEEYEALLKKQGGRCALCLGLPKAKGLAVDHDHTTGRVRGLLCIHCNTGLGQFRELPLLLERAAAYLRKSRA